MARSAGEMTTAIRQILAETRGEITHAQARERFQQMGLKVAPDPGPKSKEYRSIEAAGNLKSGVPKDERKRLEFFRELARKAGVAQNMVEGIVKEFLLHDAYIKEQNSFNVNKSAWKKGGMTVSKKPNSSKNTKAKVAAKTGRTVGRPRKQDQQPAKRGRPAKTTVAASANGQYDQKVAEALQLVLGLGGAAQAQKKLDELMQQHNDIGAQMAQIEAALEAVAPVGKLLVA